MLLGSWLKHRQVEAKDADDDQDDAAHDEPIQSTEKSSQTSLINAVDQSISVNDVQRVIPSDRIVRLRPSSAKARVHCSSNGERVVRTKEKSSSKIYPWEYDDWYNLQDLTGTTNKSALIYRLMRSRLEANLAKSISTNRHAAQQKKKISTSTSTST